MEQQQQQMEEQEPITVGETPSDSSDDDNDSDIEENAGAQDNEDFIGETPSDSEDDDFGEIGDADVVADDDSVLSPIDVDEEINLEVVSADDPCNDGVPISQQDEIVQENDTTAESNDIVSNLELVSADGLCEDVDLAVHDDELEQENDQVAESASEMDKFMAQPLTHALSTLSNLSRSLSFSSKGSSSTANEEITNMKSLFDQPIPGAEDDDEDEIQIGMVQANDQAVQPNNDVVQAVHDEEIVAESASEMDKFMAQPLTHTLSTLSNLTRSLSFSSKGSASTTNEEITTMKSLLDPPLPATDDGAKDPDQTVLTADLSASVNSGDVFQGVWDENSASPITPKERISMTRMNSMSRKLYYDEETGVLVSQPLVPKHELDKKDEETDVEVELSPENVSDVTPQREISAVNEPKEPPTDDSSKTPPVPPQQQQNRRKKRCLQLFVVACCCLIVGSVLGHVLVRYTDVFKKDSSRTIDGLESSDETDDSILRAPSMEPTTSNRPTITSAPTKRPTRKPTPVPTRSPSVSPTLRPTRSPTSVPSRSPTISSAPSRSPAPSNSESPTDSVAPTAMPSARPTPGPTVAPTKTPTPPPTTRPPTGRPSRSPTISVAPTLSESPSIYTEQPSSVPSGMPTRTPFATLTPTIRNEVVSRSDRLKRVQYPLYGRSCNPQADNWFLNVDTWGQEIQLAPNRDQLWLERYVMSCLYFNILANNAITERDGLGWLSSQHICDWDIGSNETMAMNCTDDGEILTFEVSNQAYVDGTFPSEIGLLRSLEHLGFLRPQNLIGTIPSELSRLPLKFFRCIQCSLNGTIPSHLGQLSMLTTLFLGDSFDKTRYLTGSIPTHIGGMTLLQQISIKNARLTGTIPSEIINLWNLTEMYLTGNRLSGNIPRLPKNLADCELAGLSYEGDFPEENCFPNLDDTVCTHWSQNCKIFEP